MNYPGGLARQHRQLAPQYSFNGVKSRFQPRQQGHPRISRNYSIPGSRHRSVDTTRGLGWLDEPAALAPKKAAAPRPALALAKPLASFSPISSCAPSGWICLGYVNSWPREATYLWYLLSLIRVLAQFVRRFLDDVVV